MKKIMFFLLCSILVISILSGCSSANNTKPPVTTTTANSVATNPTVSEPSAATNYSNEYLRIINEFETNYGLLTEEYASRLAPGLYYANLVDFDRNDIPELVLGYIDHGNSPCYNIYAMVNGKVQSVSSGEMFTFEGYNPYIFLAYTDELVYFVTGHSKGTRTENYLYFDGNYFNTAFSHSGNLDGFYRVNSNEASQEVYQSAVSAFEADIVNKEFVSLADHFSVVSATTENTKTTLKNSN